MSYHLIGISPKDKILKKYDLYLRHGGVTYRKRVKCPKSYIEKIHSDWLHSIYSGDYNKPLKLKDVLEEYIKVVLPSKSRNEELRFIRLVEKIAPIKNKNISEIKQKDLQTIFLTGYKNPHSFNRQLNTLSAFLNWSDRQRYGISSKVLHGMRKQEPEGGVILLTTEQVNTILGRCKLPHQRTFILLALFTGMRHGEILNLKWVNINFGNSYIELPSRMTKSKKVRYIPIIPQLKQYLESISRECDYVVSYMNKPLVTFKKSWVKIGRDVCRIHDLRHHFATVLINAGVSKGMVQKALGHSSPKMTDHYSQMTPTMIADNINSFQSGFYDSFTTEIFLTDKT